MAKSKKKQKWIRLPSARGTKLHKAVDGKRDLILSGNCKLDRVIQDCLAATKRLGKAIEKINQLIANNKFTSEHDRAKQDFVRKWCSK